MFAIASNVNAIALGGSLLTIQGVMSDDADIRFVGAVTMVNSGLCAMGSAVVMMLSARQIDEVHHSIQGLYCGTVFTCIGLLGMINESFPVSPSLYHRKIKPI